MPLQSDGINRSKLILKIIYTFTIAATLIAHVATASEKSAAVASHSKVTKNNEPTHEINPFDYTMKSLPVNYAGHSIANIYKKLTPPPSKGEYETTSEYNARIDQWMSTAILGNITPKDDLIFRIENSGSLRTKYDADNELLSAEIDMYDGVWLSTWSKENEKTGSRIGTTPMGIKFRITSGKNVSEGLKIVGKSKYISIGGGRIEIAEKYKDISISFPYSRENAIKFKDSIKGYAIAKLSEPYKYYNSETSIPSLDGPYEYTTEKLGLYATLKAIWIVNTDTGEVLAKKEAPFAPCEGCY